MLKQRCLYCGHETVSLIEKKEPSTLQKLLFVQNDIKVPVNKTTQRYECSSCGLIFTRQELDKENERIRQKELYQGSGSPDEQADEEKTLEEAKRLLRDTCFDADESGGADFPYVHAKKPGSVIREGFDNALDVLFRCGCPLKHPLEFMIYRDICQTGDLLLCGKSDIGERYLQLDTMLSDIQHIDYFLPQNDGETLFTILGSLHDALLLLGSMPVNYHTSDELSGITNESEKFFTDLTCRKRAAILGLFAERLEELQASPRGTDYLKMALKLWHKILEQAHEKRMYMKMGLGGDRMSQIPYEMRSQIVAKIQQLNEIVQQRDPHFRPDELPEQPIHIPAWAAAAAALAGIALFALWIYLMIAVPSAAKTTSKVVEWIMWASTLGTDHEIVMYLTMPVCMIILLLIYSFIESKVFPIIYNYYKTRH